MPGNVKVVVKKNLVGVVADKPWQALQAAEKLKVTWTPGPALPNQRDFYTYLRNHPGRRDAYSVNSKDVDAKLQGATTRVKATYLHPYQMHGSIGSSCAVADVNGSNATVWSSTQAVYPLRGTTAMVLGLQPQNVRVIYVRGSGCYGLNGSDAVAYDAAILSQAVGKPVRVQLTRKDEMVWGENYGLPFVVDQQAGLDASGNIVAWDYETWSATLGNRPGNNAPGNVASGLLLGFAPQAVAPRAQAPDPHEFRQWQQRGPGVRDWSRRREEQRHRHRRQRARADAYRSIAVPYRAAALAGTAAERVRAGMLLRRDRGAGEGRSGAVPLAAHQRSALERRHHRGGQAGELGYAAVAQGWDAAHRHRQRTRHGVRALRGRQRLRRARRRSRRQPGHRRRSARSGSLSRRMSGRSRARMACATSSKAGRCRD